MISISEMYGKYNIPAKGIVHIGAFEAAELPVYERIGIPKVFYIEANPKVYTKLKDRIFSFNNIEVLTFCCAITNNTGTCKLHITSEVQSSSILPLKIHREIYPTIKEVDCIDISCYTLDELFVHLKLNPSDFNFINIDIQGAELLAFQGAVDLLTNHIIAINTEVNFVELYEGCVQEPELTKYLQGFNFVKKGEVKPWHPSWGDAFYVKESKNG